MPQGKKLDHVKSGINKFLRVCTGAQELSSKEMVERIWELTSTEDLYEVCTICAAAKEKYKGAARIEFVEQLPFDRSGFSKRAAVGEDERLQPIMNRLPPFMTILHKLSTLTDEELSDAVKTGIVHRRMKRAALERWILHRRGQERGDDRHVGIAPRDAIRAKFNMPPNMTTNDIVQFRIGLNRLCEAHNIGIGKFTVSDRGRDTDEGLVESRHNRDMMLLALHVPVPDDGRTL